MRYLITNGLIVDPANKVHDTLDLFIEDGKIAQIGKNIRARLSGLKDSEQMDAQGLLVIPGLVDLHTHLREPGYEYKETIRTGTASAAAGGFTTICVMPNTDPVNDHRSVTEFILKRAREEGLVNVCPIGAITKGSRGEELAEIAELKDAGCVAISDDGNPVVNSLMMRRAMEYARTFDLPVIDHCEDPALSAGGAMQEGKVSTELGLRGIPSASEEVMVARDLILAQSTGSHFHAAHVSTAGSVRMIREAKSRSVPVTTEACPHHFTLTHEEVRGYDANKKMNPPLRNPEDAEAVIEGLRDGTIDAIATDHAPHAEEEKLQEFETAPFGVIGLETAWALAYELVLADRLSLDEVVARMTCGPARIIRSDRGTLSVGSAADVTLINNGVSWTVDPGSFHSKSRNTPVAGWKFRSQVVQTIVSGRTVWPLAQGA